MIGQPPPQPTPRGFAARSPRLSPREVISAARGETAAHAKGRPPPAATTSSFDYASRAMLAKFISDAPPRDEGFGGKVSTDGEQLVDVFTGGVVPPRLQLTAEELEQREIAKVVNQGEGAALSCLTSILKDSESAMAKCEGAMAAEHEKAKAAVAEMDSRGPDSHRPGIRNGRRRRKKKPQSGKGAAGKDVDAGSEYTEGDGEEGEEGDEEEDESGLGRKYRNLPLPVAQGAAEYFLRRAAADGEEGAGMQYDEYGELVEAPFELGPTADRMHRLISVGGPEAAECAFAEHPWPTITQADVIKRMRRARFFREAELQEDFLPVIAAWFEVQCWDAGLVVAEEGSWCHSFAILYEGTVEARGRVYRTPGANPPARANSLLGAVGGGRGVAKDGRAAGDRDSAAPKDESGSGADEGDEGGGAAEGSPADSLPTPHLAGTYDTLAPVLLHPGAYFGEAALAGPPHEPPRLPHTCTVRTLERCTLLVLRRSTLLNELKQLPVTARQAWEQQSLREMRLFSLIIGRWQHHALRRLRIFRGIEQRVLLQLERFMEYRLLPEHTTLYRAGESVTHLFIVLDGQLGEFEMPSPSDVQASLPPRLAGGMGGGGLQLPTLTDDDDEEGEEAPAAAPAAEELKPTGMTEASKVGHDVTDIRPWIAPPPPSLEPPAAPPAKEPPAEPPPPPLPPLRRKISDASDVPFAGEAPLLLPTAHEAASHPPSATIVLTLTMCRVVAIPYAELAKRGNLLVELRKRATDARAQPSALMALLQPPQLSAKTKLKAKLGAAASLLGLAREAAAAAPPQSKAAAAAAALAKVPKPPLPPPAAPPPASSAEPVAGAVSTAGPVALS